VLSLNDSYFIKARNYKEPKIPLYKDFFGNRVHEVWKYISGDERRRYKLAKVNLPLLNMRLKLFVEGRKNWLKEGLLVPAKKKKR
jgi:hypothetical protein